MVQVYDAERVVRAGEPRVLAQALGGPCVGGVEAALGERLAARLLAYIATTVASSIERVRSPPICSGGRKSIVIRVKSWRVRASKRRRPIVIFTCPLADQQVAAAAPRFGRYALS
jgi:hypothetical protein